MSLYEDIIFCPCCNYAISKSDRDLGRIDFDCPVCSSGENINCHYSIEVPRLSEFYSYGSMHHVEQLRSEYIHNARKVQRGLKHGHYRPAPAPTKEMIEKYGL